MRQLLTISVAMNAIERIAYDYIEKITAEKEGVVSPVLATIDEIKIALHADLNEALRNLYKQGIISFNIDINKKPMFKIKQSQKL